MSSQSNAFFFCSQHRAKSDCLFHSQILPIQFRFHLNTWRAPLLGESATFWQSLCSRTRDVGLKSNKKRRALLIYFFIFFVDPFFNTRCFLHYENHLLFKLQMLFLNSAIELISNISSQREIKICIYFYYC